MDPVADDNNQQAAPDGANPQLPAIDGNQPPAVHEDPYRMFVIQLYQSVSAGWCRTS